MKAMMPRVLLEGTYLIVKERALGPTQTFIRLSVVLAIV